MKEGLRLHKLPSLRQFLSPIWRYSLSDRWQNNPNVRLNQVILRAIDNQLHSAGEKTVASRMDLYLQDSRKEFLDYFGSWIGLERLSKHESDDHYRKRLINHVKHPRATIPALRSAISKYLHMHMSDVHIYEPWQDAFITNDYASRTNSRSHLFGYYCRPAIIDIVINKPFTDPGVVDYINWFRPVGVMFLITYQNGPEADVWKFLAPNPKWHTDKIRTYIGFSNVEQHANGILDKNDSYGDNPFYLSDTRLYNIFDPKFNGYKWKTEINSHLSDLNSLDVLLGGDSFGKPYMSYLGTLHSLLKVTRSNDMDYFDTHTVSVDPSKYSDIQSKDGLDITVTSKFKDNNMLTGSGSFDRSWELLNKTYLSGTSYQNNTAVDMIGKGSELKYVNDIAPLIKGRKYYLSLAVKSNDIASHNSLEVHLNKDQAVQLKGTSTNDWTVFSNTFTYNGDNDPTFDIVRTDDQSNPLMVSSPMLSDDNRNWQPSPQDLGEPILNPNSEYVYIFLNIWNYYFKNIQSRASVWNSIRKIYHHRPTAHLINKYIAKQYPQKFFNLVYKPVVADTITTRLWLMNFKRNVFTNYETHDHIVGNKIDKYNLSVHELPDMVNNNGYMVIALQVPAYQNDYTLELHNIGLVLQDTKDGQAGIKLYKPYPNYQTWVNLHDWHILDWLGSNSDTDQYDMRAKAQRHYPIRYIRNWIRNVSFGGNDSDDFILNDSLLNGTKLLNKFDPNNNHQYYNGFLNRPILPSLTDYSNPVKSVSILGATTGDKYPTNVLNNLLKNSIFGYFTPKIWGYSKVEPKGVITGNLTNKSSVYMLKDINSDHVWFNNRGAKLWTTTDSIGSRNRYILSFTARTKSTHDKVFRVRVKLHSNHFTQNLSRRIAITHKRRTFNLVFNTYGIFPDTVTISWTYLGNMETSPELFKDLKANQNTFLTLKKDNSTFEDIFNHKLGADGNSTKASKDPKPSEVVACKRRPDITYMPNEPAYVYWGNGKESEVPKPTEYNKDIDDGWNFNGNLPIDYTPALIPKPDKASNADPNNINDYMPGYVPNSLTNKLYEKQDLSYIPDDKGDLALGYSLVNMPSPDWVLAYVELNSGKFAMCQIPFKYAYVTENNANPADIEFRDISCHLLAKVYKDGRLTHHVAPQLNYKGQDTLAYNDIQFGQPINENDIGETFGDLSRYANDFTEFEKYGWEFQDLIAHKMLSDNITWGTLEQNRALWKQAEQDDWTWTPVINVDDLVDDNVLNPKADNTTFKDIISHDFAERFGNLNQYHNTFNQFHQLQLTFADLRRDLATSTGVKKSSNDITWDTAKNSYWLFQDGEPFDHSEHNVTIDLGRVYTNIDHLLVHHGSGSLPGAVYDSCVQTSTDGKHWKTWYDNYKGTRSNDRLDNDYIEPTNAPLSIPISRYDCFNEEEDINKHLSSQNYVYSHTTHYPTKHLHSLLFDDDRTKIPLYNQYYWTTKSVITPYIPSLNDMMKYKLDRYTTGQNQSHNHNQINPSQNTNNSNSLDLETHLTQTNDVSSNHYWIRIFQDQADQITDPKMSKVSHDLMAMPLFANSNLNSQNPRAMDRPLVTKPEDMFILNNDLHGLNSHALLQNGHSEPIVHHKDQNHKGDHHGDIPNPDYSPYMYEAKLLKFNVVDLVTDHFPDLEKKLKEYGITNEYPFTKGLIANCTTLNIDVNAKSSGKWYLAVWDNKTSSWQYANINPLNGGSYLQLTNYEDMLKEGQIYVLVLSEYNKAIDKPILDLNSVDLQTLINMNDVDDYEGGLYPHINQELNGNKLYTIAPTDKVKTIKLPWINRTMKGHKVTVSFNMIASAQGGSFQLSLGRLHQDPTPIEKGYQNFKYVFDIPDNITKKGKYITPAIQFNYVPGTIYIYGFKAELGVSQSPYVYPYYIN